MGTDIVHLPRISRLISRRDYLTRFTRRILDEQEHKDFQTRFKETLQLHGGNSKYPPVTAEMTRWLAGRFAAKEAARKAAPDGAASISWKDVVVRAQGGTGNKEDASAMPEIVFWPDGKDGKPGSTGQVSISHDGEYAFATVLAWNPPVRSKAIQDRNLEDRKGDEENEYKTNPERRKLSGEEWKKKRETRKIKTLRKETKEAQKEAQNKAQDDDS
jgi:holo-[acyl-carrier protein] synthase